MYLKVSDNNGSDFYGPFNNKRDTMKERTSIIQAYGYNKGKGFTRETDGDEIIFRHPIYSTVVFTITN